MGRGVKVHNGDRTLRRGAHVDDFAAITKAPLLGDVQVPAAMKTGSDGPGSIEKASLATVAAEAVRSASPTGHPWVSRMLTGPAAAIPRRIGPTS